jgi:non-ribosomal peptide synthetase component E (peptide arylation enzyme)
VAQSRSLLGCLAEHARLRPDSVALIMGAERVTYADLCAMSLAAFRRIEDLAWSPAGRSCCPPPSWARTR